MPAHYTSITIDDMSQLLQQTKGWQSVSLTPYQEIYFDFSLKLRFPEFVNKMVVSNKVAAQHLPTGMVIRVYSSITPDGLSRERGKDAIRVCIIAKFGQHEKGLKGFSRVYRTQGWRDNLRERVMEAHEFSNAHVRYCIECGSLMVARKGRVSGQEFLGCMAYPSCKYTDKI
jgi:hypothetical protein